MDSNIIKNKRLKVTLEKISKAQNSCFWEAIALPNGLEINWGIQGTQGNSRLIPAQNCSGRNPARELQERMKKKLKDTYTLKDYNSITI